MIRFVFLSLFITCAAEAAFPEDWFGEWAGTVKVDSNRTDTQELKMDLVIGKIKGSENISWKIRYEGEVWRNYELQPVDKEKGHWVLDEKIGILIDHYLRDGVLFSFFAVNGRGFETRTRLIDGKLHQEGSAYELQTPRESGGGNVPTVYSFPIGTTQSVVMTKK